MPYQKTKMADEDIINLYVYGFKSFGREQAERYHADLEKTFLLLNLNPQMARERTEFSPPVRLHFHASHIIIYTITGQDILILRVLPNGQDWEQYLS